MLINYTDLPDNCFCDTNQQNFDRLVVLGFNFVGFRTGVINSFKQLSDRVTLRIDDVFQMNPNDRSFYLCGHNIAAGTKINFFKKESEEQSPPTIFIKPVGFNIEILKEIKTNNGLEYYGLVYDNDVTIIVTWNETGECCYKKYSLHKEYKQTMFTKLNSEGFYPSRKFKFSWTADMSKHLEESGWRRATDEEIEGFKK